LFPKKLGGKVLGVPLPIGERKSYTFAIKFIIKLLKDKYRIVSLNKLVELFYATLYNKGDAIDKKLSLYKIGLENRDLVRFFKPKRP
jgi:ribosomal protein S7